MHTYPKHREQPNLVHGKTWALFLVLAILLGAGLVQSVGAEDSASGAAPVMAAFADVVDVRLINLEVAVTQVGGGRVAGLEAGDFRLLVDGKEQEIELFTPVHGGKAMAAAERQTAPGIPGLTPGQAVGTHYLIFLDNYFVIPSHRNRILRRLGAELESLGGEDRMALVAYDGGDLEVLSPWTQSRVALKRALEEAAERPAHGLRTVTQELRGGRLGQGFPNRRGSFSHSGFSGRRAGIGDPTYRTAAQQSVARVSRAAAAAMRGFSAAGGRKVMIMLSGSWPIAATEWGGSRGLGTQLGFYTGKRLLAPVVDTANRLGFTIYPVDVFGGQSGTSNIEVATPQGLDARRLEDTERELGLEDSLQHLARETGGLAFLDAAGLSALGRVVEDAGSYYWLAFTPTWTGDGKERRIEVQVQGRGRKVRFRRGYSDLARAEEVSMQMEAALRFGAEIEGAGGLSLLPGEASRAGIGKMKLPLLVRIAAERLTLPGAAPGAAPRFQLLVASRDGRGQISRIPVAPFDLEPRVGKPVEQAIEILLRREKHRLLVALYDTLTGETLSAEIEVDPRS